MEMVSFTPGRFTPGEIASGTHWIGGWVGPRASLDVMEKREIFPLSGIEPRPSSPLAELSRYKYMLKTQSNNGVICDN
jgi:hypothetical protein